MGLGSLGQLPLLAEGRVLVGLAHVVQQQMQASQFKLALAQVLCLDSHLMEHLFHLVLDY